MQEQVSNLKTIRFNSRTGVSVRGLTCPFIAQSLLWLADTIKYDPFSQRHSDFLVSAYRRKLLAHPQH